MCIILAVNAGSSSLKITIYRKIKQASGEHDHSASCVSLEPGTPELVSTATISDIATTNPSFMLNGKSLPTYGITDHGTAFARFLSELNCSHDSSSEQPQRNRIRYVCHRIVHGGPQPPAPVASDDRGILLDRSSESYHRLTAPAMSDLAPLHNRAALSVVEACFEQLPQAKSAAYFDTSFHRSIPPHVAAYPVDPSFARQRGLTKYGFHGLSCAIFPGHVPPYFPSLTKISTHNRRVHRPHRFSVPWKAHGRNEPYRVTPRIRCVSMCDPRWTFTGHVNGPHSTQRVAGCDAFRKRRPQSRLSPGRR